MVEIMSIINQYATIIMVVLVVIMILFAIMLGRQNEQIKQMKKKYATLTRGVEGADWSQLLERLSEEADANAIVLNSQQEEIKHLEKRMVANFNRISIKHYNAFDFTYGDLSFSMAILDDLGSGFIFTNIHNRDDARCYCKRIIKGESKHPMSEEEKEVLEQALNGNAVFSRKDRD